MYRAGSAGSGVVISDIVTKVNPYVPGYFKHVIVCWFAAPGDVFLYPGTYRLLGIGMCVTISIYVICIPAHVPVRYLPLFPRSFFSASSLQSRGEGRQGWWASL